MITIELMSGYTDKLRIDKVSRIKLRKYLASDSLSVYGAIAFENKPTTLDVTSF